MSDVVVGGVLVLFGLALTFRGATLMRLLITVWGGLLGLSLGAGLVASVNGEPLLSSPAGWLVGGIAAIAFAALAYAFYVVGVLLALGSFGFAFGDAAADMLGIGQGWATFAIAVTAGLLVAIVGLALNLPRLLLVALSAIGGAAVTIAGAMVLTGAATVIGTGAGPAGWSVSEPVSLGWSLGCLALAGAGLISQLHSGGDRPRRRRWSGYGARMTPAGVR